MWSSPVRRQAFQSDDDPSVHCEAVRQEGSSPVRGRTSQSAYVPGVLCEAVRLLDRKGPVQAPPPRGPPLDHRRSHPTVHDDPARTGLSTLCRLHPRRRTFTFPSRLASRSSCPDARHPMDLARTRRARPVPRGDGDGHALGLVPVRVPHDQTHPRARVRRRPEARDGLVRPGHAGLEGAQVRVDHVRVGFW